MSKSFKPVEIKQIKSAYIIAAKIVELFGDQYLILFERLYNELQKEEIKLNLKALALKIAQ